MKRSLMIIEQIPVLNQLPPEIRGIMARLLVLIVALLIIWVARRLLARLILTPLRSIVQRSESDVDDQLLEAMILPVRLLVIAIGIQVIAQTLLADDVFFLVFLSGVTRTLIVIALLIAAYRLVEVLLKSSRQIFSITGMVIEDRLVPFVRVALKLFVIAVGVVMVLNVWGFDISGLVAGIGLGGLGLTLAAQDTVANLFGFISIVGDRPFDVGDFIKTPDVEGSVEHVGLRSTRVRQRDQALVTVPNAKLANSAILNWSRLYKRQIDFILGVTYTTSVDQMRELLERIRSALTERESVQKDSVIAYFINFGSSSLEVLIRCYVLIADWGAFTAEKERINLQIINIVREMGLEVALPTQTVHIQNIPEVSSLPRVAEQSDSIMSAAPKSPPEETPRTSGTPQGSDAAFLTSSEREK